MGTCHPPTAPAHQAGAPTASPRTDPTSDRSSRVERAGVLPGHPAFLAPNTVSHTLSPPSFRLPPLG